MRRKKALAANRTDSARDAMHTVKTLLAHRQTRHFSQRFAAYPAIGGKENCKKIFGELK
jgi:hypothetical protein